MLEILKNLIRRRLQRALIPTAAEILDNPYTSAKLFPLEGSTRRYALPMVDSPADYVPTDDLPIPPEEFWEHYGRTVEIYLNSGRRHVACMLDILRAHGAAPELLPRVLEFGCAAARMLRFYPYVDAYQERWGADIGAKHIAWCQQHFGRPFRFVTTTTTPHLPFEDNYFDLVFAGSVFTHLSNLAEAWLLELRRIVRAGGYIYVTVHDENTVRLLYTKYRKSNPGLLDLIRSLDQSPSLLSNKYNWFAIDAEPRTQVFYNGRYVTKKWAHLANILSVTAEAYEYQTAILMQKPQPVDFCSTPST